MTFFICHDESPVLVLSASFYPVGCLAVHFLDESVFSGGIAIDIVTKALRQLNFERLVLPGLFGMAAQVIPEIQVAGNLGIPALKDMHLVCPQDQPFGEIAPPGDA